MPAYRIDGHYALGFGVTKAACSFYTGRAPVQAHAEALAPYRLWKGTINFTPDAPLPADLVAKLIATRVAELAGAPTE